MIASIPPERKVLALFLSGLVAGFGWYFLYTRAKHIIPIGSVIKGSQEMSSFSNFCHGLLQLITVSMGAPVGREGASREVSTSISNLWLKNTHLSKEEIKILLACASGSALGAVYNAPFATSLFILETLRVKRSFKMLISAIFSSFFSVLIVQFFIGRIVQYQLPRLQIKPQLFLFAVLASLIISIIAYYFRKLLATLPKQKLAAPIYISRIIICFTLIGFISIYFPQILGNGRAGLLFILHHQTISSYYLLGLVLAKAIAVTLVFFSGASGGKIAPSMMLGGSLASLLAVGWNYLFPFQIDSSFATIIGSSIFLGQLNRMPLSAVFFLTEISGQPIINSLPLLMALIIMLMLNYFVLNKN